jgi:acyl-CoA thioesterase
MTDEPRTETSHSAQQIADKVGAGMLADDNASRSLGIRVARMAPGYACLSMTVRNDMLNGFRICHGGFITTLADSAFAFACNSHNRLTLAAGIVVDFIAPANEGDMLTAEAREVSRSGRTGIYDVSVTNQDGTRIAVLRGRAHELRDRKTVP